MSERPRSRRRPLSGLGRRLRSFRSGARNALELLKDGRIGAPYQAPHREHHREATFVLRRYTDASGAPGEGAPLLLVPPLMVTTEIYDISPELSAVAWLRAQGLDVWVVDFGSPERVEGGLERTLDDHILAVSEAVGRVVEATGRPAHLAGYSQGGMFAYQAAAYRRSDGVASLITFGSPVDLRRNLPVKVHDDLAEAFIRAAGAALSGPFQSLEQLPAAITSNGFKLLNPRKELQQLMGLFGALPNREALERREPRRRFLGGDGFVAWPGPAFRDFVDSVIVQNRMASGGFVIDGRAVSLADITCPVLCFMGTRDELARPAAVRGIKRAAPRADVQEQVIEAGHFGLVVGSRAMGEVWPTVAAWIDAGGRLEPGAPDDGAPSPGDAGGTRALYDVATVLADSLWHRVGDASLNMVDLVETMRWQLPRLARLESLHPRSRVSPGRALAEQAAAIPDEPFLLWRGRAYTYAEAERRVNQVLHVLLELGVTPGDHVALLMDTHPDVLTALTALSRMGAVAVLLNTGLRGASLEQALEVGEVRHLIVGPGHLEEARAVGREVWLFGQPEQGDPPEGVTHLDARIDPSVTAPPEGVAVNEGRAEELAMLLYTSGTTGLPKAARITNRRWALAALGSAAACRLTPADTVYCPLPLHHATGLLVAVGGAMVGGSRLALVSRFSARDFWSDVRRSGATVVFYVGELCRYLVNAPPQEGEERHPVRLFVGNGLRPDVWRRLQERFGEVPVLEFYGSTEGNVALANLAGEKVGSVGRPIPGAGEVALVRLDAVTGEHERDAQGWRVRCGAGEAGELLARIHEAHPMGHFEGYTDPEATAEKVLRGVFEPGDAWFATGDLLRQDEEGDFWFVDRIGDTFRWRGENVSTEQVAVVLDGSPQVRMAAVYGVALPGQEGRAGMAALELNEGQALDGAALFERVEANLFPAARPLFVRCVARLEVTGSLKIVKHRLQREGIAPEGGDPVWVYDAEARAYVPMNDASYARAVRG